jgi:hypothetical protein
MMFHLFDWAARTVVAAFVLLLLSLLLWFIWNVFMRLFHGTELGFFDIALLAFLAAIAVGSWGVSFLPQPRARTTP